MFGWRISKAEDTPDGIDRLREALDKADAVVVGAGAGLSASAGFVYTGERFERYFHDFAETYHFRDMYSGGFHPYDTLEEYWAYWSRYIYINRYMDAPKPVYHKLYDLVKDKEYFVLTTNVDHCFQKAGFDKHWLFYTQGDYGLFQCSRPCHQNTYDNETVIREMVEAQGYRIDADGTLILPEGTLPERTVPSDLVPHCPKCQKPMSMNLRADHTFVEDRGWHPGFRAVCRIPAQTSECESAVFRGSSGIQYAGNRKIQLLAHGTPMERCGLCLSELWRGICAG